MLAVISPAKTLDYETALPRVMTTEPRFAIEAATLARAAARLPQKRLRALMAISPALAKLNADRFRTFANAPERPALYAFAGDVYRGLDAATLDEAAIDYAQDHLRMLSGLYGLLRQAHGWLGYAFFAVILVHLGGALFHALVRRDGVFEAMAPVAGRAED